MATWASFVAFVALAVVPVRTNNAGLDPSNCDRYMID